MNSFSLLFLLAAAFLVSLSYANIRVPFHNRNSLYIDGEKIRGTNLGGWLVLEPWIRPSLFDQFIGLPEEDQAVDEYTFCQKLGYEEAERQLREHWANWVSYEELQTLADSDITHIRIPVGYWIVDIQPGEPWVDGGIEFLNQGIEWARKAGLKVLIDLHGAPGSQNGFDNSGVRGDVHWDDNSTEIDRTVYVLSILASLYDTQEYRDVVIGIELVNEPRYDVDINLIKNFYLEGYNAIRNSSEDSVWDMTVFIHDAFRFGDWNGFMQPPEYQNVVLDTHIYQVFNEDQLLETDEQHLDDACGNKARIQTSEYNLWTVVGEWCLATTDCTEWLNGFGVGARYDGTMYGYPYIGTCQGRNDITNSTVFTPEYRSFLNEFFEYQYDAFSAGSGFFFWNFKAESSPQWSYLQGLEEGWIPKDLDSITRSCDDRMKKRAL